MAPSPRLDQDALLAILERQIAVVTRRQALAVGVTRHALRHRLRVGGPWRRLLPGVYVAATGTPTSLQQEMAALLYAGRGNVIAEQRPGPPAVPARTGSGGEMLVRSKYGAACGSGSETALALGAGFG